MGEDLLTGGKTYAASWNKVGEPKKFNEANLKAIRHIDVVNTKDENGNLTDKLSLAIYVGDKGERKFRPVDKNSKLKAGDRVKPESVTAQEYSNGDQNCVRFDGEAL